MKETSCQHIAQDIFPGFCIVRATRAVVALCPMDGVAWQWIMFECASRPLFMMTV